MFAFVMKTDATNPGHEWVVLCAGNDEVELYERTFSLRTEVDFEYKVVKLCSKYKAKPGALIGDDEYN
jgi:hypothetical protein